MYKLIFVAAILGLLIFIYFTRYVENKREERRHDRNIRRQEILEKMLADESRVNREGDGEENRQSKERDQ